MTKNSIPKSPEKLHLRPQDRQRLIALLEIYLPDVVVWAYGSRVNGRSHDGSDLDLVLRSPDLSPIDYERLSAFDEALKNQTSQLSLRRVIGRVCQRAFTVKLSAIM